MGGRSGEHGERQRRAGRKRTNAPMWTVPAAVLVVDALKEEEQELEDRDAAVGHAARERPKDALGDESAVKQHHWRGDHRQKRRRSQPRQH